ncbi:hypothetical protein Ate01nite_63130 [Actinoplanes teichomyceticus]|nr:hypothetical protein Ate01nite_63130 [Actinoplanes teichomyceticus]
MGQAGGGVQNPNRRSLGEVTVAWVHPGVRGMDSHVSPVAEQRLVDCLHHAGRTPATRNPVEDHCPDTVAVTGGTHKSRSGEVTRNQTTGPAPRTMAKHPPS